MDFALSRLWKRDSGERMIGVEEHFRRAVEVEGIPPSEILIVAGSQSTLEVLRESVAGASLITILDLCRRILRENAVAAGVDPRFSVLSESRRRVMAGRIADEIIAHHLDDLRALGLVIGEDTSPARTAILRISRHDELTPIPPADPAPFLDAFEHCCMELIAPMLRDDMPDKIIERIRLSLPKMLLAAHSLADAPEWTALDWKALDKLRAFRGAFGPRSRLRVTDHRLRAARDAFDAFIGACLDRQSVLCTDLLSGLAAEFRDRYASEKSADGLLDHDDLAAKATALLDMHPDAYRGAHRLVLPADADELTDDELRVVHAITGAGRLFIGSFGVAPHMSPDIADFANFLLGKVWAEEPVSEHQPIRHSERRSSTSEPGVELVILPRDYIHTPVAIARRRRAEARAVAERIVDMTADGAYSFRDILVILRSASGLSACERVLQEHGIPACAVGGYGFYDAPEVRDAITILRAIAGSPDDEVLSGVLDSPFSEALDWLSELRSMSDTASAGELLSIALGSSGCHVRLLTMRDGLRKYANIRRLLDMAADLSLDEFIARVDEADRFGAREPESSLGDPDGDVVRVMTLRDARNLHAPVVFLAGLSRPLSSDHGMAALHPERGLAVRPADMTGRINVPLSYREVTSAVEGSAVLEEKRLLRTALTRAHERLILVGSSILGGEFRSTYRETGSWMGWIEKALLLNPQSHPGILEMGGCRVKLSFAEPNYISPKDSGTSLLSLYPDELWNGRPLPVEADPVIGPMVERCLSVPVMPARRVTRLSVSQVLDYIECPAMFRFRHVLGVPDTPPDPPDDMQDTDVRASDLGHAVHDILSWIDFSADSGHELEKHLARITNLHVRAEAEPLVRRFLSGKWAAELRRAESMLREVPFELMVHDKVLAGRIDVMYQASDGWTVLDYKTGRAEDRTRYELQVGIYAHAIRTLTGETPARSALVLLSIDDEWVRDTFDGVLAGSAYDRIGEVARAVDEGHFAPTPADHCAWCSFHTLCMKE